MDTELLAKLFFVFYVLIAFFGALVAVIAKNIVRAMTGLILTLFGVAGLYLVMNAPLVALMQLLIYLGAVVVLIFFAIMLTRAPADSTEREHRGAGQWLLAVLGGIVPAGILALVCLKVQIPSQSTPEAVPIKALGQALIQDYVLAFELISVVLLVAMIGAVLLAWQRRVGR